MNWALKLEKVSKVFELPDNTEVVALNNVELEVAKEEFIAVVGPSGSGKTTLLNLMAGLEMPTTGEILLYDETIKGPDRDRGVVFQQDAIFPWRTVKNNIKYGLEIQNKPKEEMERIAEHFIEMVGLQGFEDAYPKQLSGGMKKRVAIAEVLANDPEVLLLDEPFGSLDYVTKLELERELEQIWDKQRKTAILVTHDLEEAVFLSDRVLVLVDGSITYEYSIPFKRPRKHDLRVNPDFIDVKKKLWDKIEKD